MLLFTAVLVVQFFTLVGRLLSFANVLSESILMNSLFLLNLEVSVDGLSLMFRRWATKKTAGSSKNGRDSKPKNLGVKKFGGEVT